MAFLLFAGDDYYPQGGAEDLKGSFPSVAAAIEGHDPNEFNYDGGWANVLCLDSLKIVKWFSRGDWFDDNPQDLP